MRTEAPREVFDSSARFVARRAFVWQGRVFKQGAEFDWRAAGCTEDTLRKMVGCGRLLCLPRPSEAPQPEEDARA